MPTGWKQCQAPKGERPKEKSTNKIVNILGQNINCGSCCLTDTACPVDLECDEVVRQWLQAESEE